MPKFDPYEDSLFIRDDDSHHSVPWKLTKYGNFDDPDGITLDLEGAITAMIDLAQPLALREVDRIR
jgi:hypothetical protein